MDWLTALPPLFGLCFMCLILSVPCADRQPVSDVSHEQGGPMSDGGLDDWAEESLHVEPQTSPAIPVDGAAQQHNATSGLHQSLHQLCTPVHQQIHHLASIITMKCLILFVSMQLNGVLMRTSHAKTGTKMWKIDPTLLPSWTELPHWSMLLCIRRSW